MQPLLPDKTEIPDASRAEDSAIMQLSECYCLWKVKCPNIQSKQ